MLHSMCVLTFVNTNKGIVARQVYRNAEAMFFNQVWRRVKPGEWTQCHLYDKNKSCTLYPAFLETLYANRTNAGDLPYEDFW
jgi:hypothetical protein